MSKKKSVRLGWHHWTTLHLQFYSPYACVHSATKVTVRICRTRVSQWPVRTRSFSKKIERKAISESSNPLPPAAPHFFHWASLPPAMGQLGVTATRWEMISPLGKGSPCSLGRQQRKEQRRVCRWMHQIPGCRGAVSGHSPACFCSSHWCPGLRQGAVQSTGSPQTFIRVHMVNWNISSPTALIHSV